MNPLRTVGGRLAAALLVVVGGALAIVYLLVVPSYESSLVNTRVRDLRQALKVVAGKPRTEPGEVFPSDNWIQDEAAPFVAEGTRIVLFSPKPLLEPVADSNGGTSRDVEHDPMVRRAASATGIVSGAVDRDGSTYAEAAVAVDGAVILATAGIHNDLVSVAVVRRRVILAAIVATAFAIALGYVLARLFARRLRRLERAVERIAGGAFDEPVTDTAPDELGELARAVDRMRLQLATLDRARGEFIANASHELRTPLFSLGGFLELLGDEDVDDRTRDEFLETMRTQVARLTKLATDLLDLSRMDVGRLSVSMETVDLSALAGELASEFAPRAAATGHALELAEGASVHCRADEARVAQIGRILIDNALVHTPPGTTVSIVVERSGARALLAVVDDGPGIPFDAREAVFERFYRLAGTVASGSGLGLAIARELASLMHGSLELVSRPGATSFTLDLAVEAELPAPRVEPVDVGTGA